MRGKIYQTSRAVTKYDRRIAKQKRQERLEDTKGGNQKPSLKGQTMSTRYQRGVIRSRHSKDRRCPQDTKGVIRSRHSNDRQCPQDTKGGNQKPSLQRQTMSTKYQRGGNQKPSLQGQTMSTRYQRGVIRSRLSKDRQYPQYTKGG
jgi:hypothetical protein